MDFCSGNATASAPAVRVICHHLAASAGAKSRADLADALKARDVDGGVLISSLDVATGLGLLERAGDRGAPTWSLAAAAREETTRAAARSSAFRGLLVRALGRHTFAALDATEPVSDLAIGLTWLLHRDPLLRLDEKWDGPTEREVKTQHVAGVGNKEQWRAFARWAIALGFLRRAKVGSDDVLIVDPTDALRAVLGDPSLRSGVGVEWIRSLVRVVPMAGDPRLAAVVLKRARPQSPVLPSVGLALQVLRRIGAIEVTRSDDAASSVLLSWAGQHVAVGRIEVKEVS